MDNIRGTISRRGMLERTAAAALVTAAGSFSLSSRARAAQPKFKTAEEGFLTVAMSGSMPVTGLKDGHIVGSDTEMVVAIAKHLGLQVKPSLMAWSATIEAVKGGRADIMCGDMGWTKARAQALLLTDAIYYNSNTVLTRKGRISGTHATVADLAGHSVGAGTGYTYVPEIKKIPNVEAKLYDNDDACVRDVEAGRLDFAVFDAMSIDYMQSQHPSSGLQMLPLTFDADYPHLTGKGRAVMGMSLDNPDLFDAVNAGVKWLWATGTNEACLKRNGLTAPEYLVPPTNDPRVGVDRAADGQIIGPGAHARKDYSSLFR